MQLDFHLSTSSMYLMCKFIAFFSYTAKIGSLQTDSFNLFNKFNMTGTFFKTETI